MELRAACFCVLGVLCCWTPGYPETYHRFTDKNGVISFSNSLSDEPFPMRGGSVTRNSASAELQRAREQAQIEYWRAVESKARTMRNTPDTDVHRKRKSSLQGDDPSFPTTSSGKKLRRRATAKRNGGSSFERKSVSDYSDSKRVRYRKTKVQSWANTPVSESQKKKRSLQEGEVALR